MKENRMKASAINVKLQGHSSPHRMFVVNIVKYSVLLTSLRKKLNPLNDLRILSISTCKQNTDWLY